MQVRIHYRKFASELNILGRFSVPSMLSGAVVSPVIWVGNAIVTGTQNGYFELGVFNAANNWRQAFMFLPIAIGNVILPAIVRDKHNKNLERLNMLLAWIIVACLAIPLLAVPELVGWFYGKQYAGQSFNVTFVFIVLVCCVLAFNEGIARNLISQNKMWLGFANNLVWGVTFIISIWLLRHQGSTGVGLSYFISYLLTSLIFIPLFIRLGIVQRRMILSRYTLILWGSILLQAAIAIVTSQVVFRILGATCTLTALIFMIRSLIAARHD